MKKQTLTREGESADGARKGHAVGFHRCKAWRYTSSLQREVLQLQQGNAGALKECMDVDSGG